MESYALLYRLGVIAFAIGKIALASLVQLPYLLLMQLLPNHTRIHVITHTNGTEILCRASVNAGLTYKLIHI